MSTPYRYDHELADVVQLLPSVLADLASAEAIAAMRKERTRNPLLPAAEPRDDVTATDRVISGCPGDPDVAIRIYEPAAPAGGPRPGLLFLHGGGFMFGSIDEMDAGCQHLCGETGASVVSVEYRLAPEHPYPAAINDGYAALCWFADHAEELGVDAARIAIGGGSAGAGLAAGIALLARDRGGPALCFQLLQIPELDDRLDTPSMLEFTDTPLWNLPNARCSWRHYLGELHEADDVPYYAAPARCPDLRGLPPAYISTMQFDPLRDEGLAYGMRLLQAGVDVELHSFPGTFHGSVLFPHAGVTQRENVEILGALQRAFREEH